MEDYSDLYFEPEMTWEELRTWIKSKGLDDEDDEFVLVNEQGTFSFWDDGEIWFRKGNEDYIIAKDRTPKQIKAFIESISDKEK